jgi:phenylpropionate dioxygenase-like ring-hydroxylating dioxygenase large terminal subunit
MQAELQRQLVHRVLAHLAARTTDHEDAPTLVPVAAYADDRARLFRELPVAIGHVSQLTRPGDFLTHDATGVPLLVTRDDDNQLRAFVNVCRHRGTRVESAPCGSKTAFVCPYHNWSYGRDGSLLAQPHARGFAGISRRDLVPVPVGEAAGLIFVGGDPTQWLGAIADDLAGFNLPTSHVYRPIAVDKALCWQLAIEIFLESYHLKPTHKDSIYPMFFDNVGLVDQIGPHTRNVFPKRSIRELAELPEPTWSLRHHANVLFHIFPNTLVLVEPDHAAVLHLWPAGPGRSLLTAYMLVPEPPASDKARGYWDANDAVLQNAIAEDFAMGESIQRGLSAGANRDVVFGAFEHALAHFHRQIERFTSSPSDRSASSAWSRPSDPPCPAASR